MDGAWLNDTFFTHCNCMYGMYCICITYLHIESTLFVALKFNGESYQVQVQLCGRLVTL